MRNKKRLALIKHKVFFIKSTQAALEALRIDVIDPSLAASLNTLIDLVRYSDPMSNAELEKIEQWIQMDVEALKGDIAVGKFELASERIAAISKQLQERNEKCRLLK